MKNKINKTENNKQKHVKQSKAKTRLAQNKSKTHKLCKKQKHEEREESDRITWSPFLSTPWKKLSV